jgi:dihydrofolate synthase/folylpolyglutamate synthase
VLAPLLERAHRVVITSADPGRSLDGNRVAERLVADGYDASRVRVVPDPRTALVQTRETLAPDDLLCVAGSMYMAGVARETLLGSSDAARQSS